MVAVLLTTGLLYHASTYTTDSLSDFPVSPVRWALLCPTNPGSADDCWPAGYPTVAAEQPIEEKGVSRTVAALLCLLGLVLVIVGILLLLTWQSANLSRDPAGIGQRITDLIDQTRQLISSKFGIAPQQQKAFMEKQSSGTGQLTSVVTSIMNSLLAVAVDSVLVSVYTFLLLYFRKRLKDFILRLVGQAEQDKTRQIISESSQVAQQYLTGMAMMIGMLWMALVLPLWGLNRPSFWPFSAACWK